jgi:hypothetical protein
MTVKNLIDILSKIDGDKIIIMTEPDGIGWTNIGSVIEDECQVRIVEDDSGLFH